MMERDALKKNYIFNLYANTIHFDLRGKCDEENYGAPADQRAENADRNYF